MTEKIKSVLPAGVTAGSRWVRNKVQATRYRGDAVHCPACKRNFSRFLPRPNRDGAICPGCYSLERHRMFWLFFERATKLLTDRARVLHFAPEAQLERLLRQQANLDYVTADLFRKDVDLRLDVTAVDLPDESFDVVICSHVFEHVDDDRKAMRELRRIIRSNGWALLTAPVDWNLEDTYEDWSIVSKEGRAKAFGQWDHVRLHGRNYPDLLKEEGWDVDVTPLPLTAEESRRYGIPEKEQRIYFARPA
jgi:SAM-dependent methyltransferase